MSKYYISDIDTKINEGRDICVDVALRRIQKHIIKTIDPTFSVEEFRGWYNSDTEKPFKWGKNTYHWCR